MAERKAASVLPDPVGATTSACRPELVAVQAVALEQGGGHRRDVERGQHAGGSPGRLGVRRDRPQQVVADVEGVPVPAGARSADLHARARS